MPGLKQHVIGVSVSEPHTSELNGGISYIYIYIREHVYSEFFQKSSETIARQGKQATAHTRERERARRAAETAEQRQKRLAKRREMGPDDLLIAFQAKTRLRYHSYVHVA